MAELELNVAPGRSCGRDNACNYQRFPWTLKAMLSRVWLHVGNRARRTWCLSGRPVKWLLVKRVWPH